MSQRMNRWRKATCPCDNFRQDIYKLQKGEACEWWLSLFMSVILKVVFSFLFCFSPKKTIQISNQQVLHLPFFNAWQKSGFLVGKKCSEKVVVGIGILKMLKVNFAFIGCVRSKLCLELLAERETSMLVTHWWKNIKNKKQFVVSKEVII